MIIHNGDHAEFERDWANVPKEQRPDWPLPSFDAMDWAKSFMATLRKNPGLEIDEDLMLVWFSCALMRGYDELSNDATEFLVLQEKHEKLLHVTIMFAILAAALSLALVLRAMRSL